MALNESQVTAFLDSAAKAAKIIKETVEEDGLIHVFSHLDADGVAAAGIIGRALTRLDARFRVRITQWIEEKIMEVLADKPDLIVFRDLGSGYVDLAPVAVVGALGDLQDKYDQRMLGGLNEKIVEDGVKAGLLNVEKDLIFFGRETRPIHRTLAFSTNPFIPGLSGEEDKSLAFLANLDIKTRTDDKWRALRDLSDDEKKSLWSALADYLLSR